MELHGAIYIFKIVIGGDMVIQGGTFGHDGAESFFFSFATWPATTSTLPQLTTSARA
jgi:hypothetical protein